MSGTVSVPNSFANAQTATGAQLDANYGTIVVYINDPTNRNNYAADTGGTNTVALAFSPAIAGYTGGLEITWKAANTNSGGVQLIANSAGTRTVVNADGSSLVAGQMVAGSIYKGIDDGTRIVFISSGVPASQAQVETATAGASFLTPATARYHPGVAKATAWWNGTATGTITGSFQNLYGISSVARQGAGTWSFGLTTAFSNTQYVVVHAVAPTAGISIMQELASARTTAGFVLTSNNAGTAAVDIIFGKLAVYGDLT